MCVQLFRAVFANHVLASIFESCSKLATVVTTETLVTFFCGVMVVLVVIMVYFNEIIIMKLRYIKESLKAGF